MLSKQKESILLGSWHIFPSGLQGGGVHTLADICCPARRARETCALGMAAAHSSHSGWAEDAPTVRSVSPSAAGAIHDLHARVEAQSTAASHLRSALRDMGGEIETLRQRASAAQHAEHLLMLTRRVSPQPSTKAMHAALAWPSLQCVHASLRQNVPTPAMAVFMKPS